MPHALDLDELRIRDQLGGPTAAADVDQLVGRSVHHQRRRRDAGEIARPRARCVDGEQLPADPRRIERSIERSIYGNYTNEQFIRKF